MGLTTYKKKRNFSQTKEPSGKIREATSKKLSFVIQKHAARRLHYDFRLEMAGVLKSWAVPKGIPMHRGERHLAVHVEDHPYEYGKFEGNIPEGNYGAGSVMLWDYGTYEVLNETPLKALRDGKIIFRLNGKKLKGEWILVRTRLNDKKETKESWLIIKSDKDFDLDPKWEDQSALTHRNMESIREDERKIWTSDREKPRPAKDSSKLNADFIEPMKAQLKETIPKNEDWAYEIKLDGIRSIAVKNGKQVQLFSRTRHDQSQDHPHLALALSKINVKHAVFDGEIVALDPSGHSSFQLLQRIQDNEAQAPVRYYLFDILSLNGKSLINLPLSERKALLEKIIIKEPLRFLETLKTDPDLLWEQIKKLGLEGIMAKRQSSIYRPGIRSPDWQKIKIHNEQEFVIGGYSLPEGSRKYFGAILIGYYQQKNLIYVCKAGTGFDTQKLEELYKLFQKNKTDQCPFSNLPLKRTSRWSRGMTSSEMKKCVWLLPKLVCRIKFMEWTREGNLRHPVFIGLRDDIRAQEVTKEG